MNAPDFVLNLLANERVRGYLREAKHDALARQAQAPRVLGIVAARPQLPKPLINLLERFGRNRAEPCPTC